jgi:hypothetical protein
VLLASSLRPSLAVSSTKVRRAHFSRNLGFFLPQACFLGSKLFLYRQTKAVDVTGWTYLGPLLEYGLKESWSEWSGSECYVVRERVLQSFA